MLSDSFAHAADDAQARSLAEARVDADRIIAATESALQADADLLDPAERERIDRALERVRRCRDADNRAALAQAVTALNDVTGDFAARRMDRGVARALRGRRVDALG
jgi:molecular chaperone HscA